jgi:hypothetical protein
MNCYKCPAPPTAAPLQVFIETVDSFQGKQLDVVILSCVRASSGGGLGGEPCAARCACQGRLRCVSGAIVNLNWFAMPQGK